MAFIEANNFFLEGERPNLKKGKKEKIVRKANFHNKFNGFWLH